VGTFPLEGVLALALGPRGEVLAAASTAGYGGALVLLETATGREIARAEVGTHPVLRFSPDGATLVSRTAGALVWGDLQVLDARTGVLREKREGVVDFVLDPAGGAAWTERSTPNVVRAAGGLEAGLDAGAPVRALASAGDRLAVATEEDGVHAISIWDRARRRCLLTLPGHTDGITRLAFTADGTRLVSISADGTARLW
jgi:hypothetical protein